MAIYLGWGTEYFWQLHVTDVNGVDIDECVAYHLTPTLFRLVVNVAHCLGRGVTRVFGQTSGPTLYGFGGVVGPRWIVTVRTRHPIATTQNRHVATHTNDIDFDVIIDIVAKEAEWWSNGGQ